MKKPHAWVFSHVFSFRPRCIVALVARRKNMVSTKDLCHTWNSYGGPGKACCEGSIDQYPGHDTEHSLQSLLPGLSLTWAMGIPRFDWKHNWNAKGHAGPLGYSSLPSWCIWCMKHVQTSAGHSDWSAWVMHYFGQKKQRKTLATFPWWVCIAHD